MKKYLPKRFDLQDKIKVWYHVDLGTRKEKVVTYVTVEEMITKTPEALNPEGPMWWYLFMTPAVCFSDRVMALFEKQIMGAFSNTAFYEDVKVAVKQLKEKNTKKVSEFFRR